MKLPELKSKFKNRYAIRIIAGVLVVTLVATGSSVYSVNAAKAGSAATETVEETEVSEEAEDTEDAESSLKDLLDNGSKVRRERDRKRRDSICHRRQYRQGAENHCLRSSDQQR